MLVSLLCLINHSYIIIYSMPLVDNNANTTLYIISCYYNNSSVVTIVIITCMVHIHVASYPGSLTKEPGYESNVWYSLL